MGYTEEEEEEEMEVELGKEEGEEDWEVRVDDQAAGAERLRFSRVLYDICQLSPSPSLSPSSSFFCFLLIPSLRLW